MKNETWIKKQADSTNRILKKLGIKSLRQLVNSHIILHIIYGGNVKGGQTYVVECGRLELGETMLTIDFEDRPIEVRLDSPGGEKMAGEFEDVEEDYVFEIVCLEYREGDWTATYVDSQMSAGAFGPVNLRVEFLV